MNTISELAKANVKKDRSRSILIVISITLTMLRLTAVSSAGYGLIRIQQENAAEFYGNYHGRYMRVAKENIEEMERHAEFADIGLGSRYGEVDNAKNLTLNWLDVTVREMTYMENAFAEGHYPETENEIAAAPDFFELLGVEEPQIGDRVTISFRTDMKSVYMPEEFVICGLLRKADAETTNSLSAYTSQKHFEERVAEADRLYTVLFRLDDNVKITYDDAEAVMTELAKSCGIDGQNVNANMYYLRWKLDPGTETITVCAAVCVVVIIFSVIVIYNIFQVGIIQKVQEYGKLKAIGSTKRQLKQVVFREGMYLACIGVPLGLLVGIGVAKAAMEYVAKDLGAGGYEIRRTGVSVVSVPLLILSAALAFFTVLLALKKPMRVVTSISCVEAMRYQEAGKGAGMRKGKNSLNVISLTFANLSGNRKRTISTILSMGLSCVLFVVLANWLGNMNEAYMARSVILHGQFQLQLNYNMEDEAYPENNLNHILEENPLSEVLIRQIQEIPEVTDVRMQRILYAKQLDEEGEETDISYSILVLDREDFEWKVRDDEVKGLDYDEMSAQDAVCFGWECFVEYNGFAIGETYHFSLYDGVEEKKWDPQMIAAFGSLDADMAMTRDTYDKMGFTGITNYNIWIDCEEKDVETVGEKLKNLIEGMPHIGMDGYQNQLKIAKLSMRMLKMPAYLFCIIIAFISFMNMANTMITSIVTRKQEFGVLQAIGMTDSQLDKSLQLEGGIFSAGTASVSLVAGIPLGYALFRYCKSEGFVGLSVYRFPIKEVLFMFLFIGLLQIVLSYILSRNVKKESLVERIRYHG